MTYFLCCLLLMSFFNFHLFLLNKYSFSIPNRSYFHSPHFLSLSFPSVTCAAVSPPSFPRSLISLCLLALHYYCYFPLFNSSCLPLPSPHLFPFVLLLGIHIFLSSIAQYLPFHREHSHTILPSFTLLIFLERHITPTPSLHFHILYHSSFLSLFLPLHPSVPFSFPHSFASPSRIPRYEGSSPNPISFPTCRSP